MTVTVREYYETPRVGNEDILALWERGAAFHDSVTPSVWDTTYRSWMVQLLERMLAHNDDATILSVGCGNAFVESDLVKKNYRLHAIDVCPRAVALARSKGVAAEVADFYAWEPACRYALIYCDGVVGHLCDRDTNSGCRAALERIRTWLTPGSGTLLISNDLSLTGAAFHEHPSVRGFFLFTSEYLTQELARSRYEIRLATTYLYTRPLSGTRTRAIVAAQARE
jgi:SAM-dependent methyltransferase